MSTKLTGEQFMALIKQSGLIEAEQLKKFWKDFQEKGVNVQDAKSLSDEFVSRNLLTKWQVDKLLAGKHKGFFLGKYRLLSHLGSGGMSSVYLAEHVLMRRRVAIKVLPQARVDDTSYLQRFHREAQAVAALDHRNIVRAYDVDQEAKIHFLVMEYVAGKSLQDVVGLNGPLDFVTAAEYIRQAAEGLHHAHKANMVHRDIKPGNLLIDEKGVVKLLDMGLARFFGEKDEHSLTIQHDEKVLGTADYLAPEQALDSHTVDIRADIYSLGCTMYYLLTGHPPFPEGTMAQRLLAHQTKEPTPIREKRPDFPAGLEAIVHKMMMKKTVDRYQTAREVSQVLTKWLLDNGGAAWSAMNPFVTGASTIVPRESAVVKGLSGISPASVGEGRVGGPATPPKAPPSTAVQPRATSTVAPTPTVLVTTAAAPLSKGASSGDGLDWLDTAPAPAASSIPNQNFADIFANLTGEETTPKDTAPAASLGLPNADISATAAAPGPASRKSSEKIKKENPHASPMASAVDKPQPKPTAPGPAAPIVAVPAAVVALPTPGLTSEPVVTTTAPAVTAKPQLPVAAPIAAPVAAPVAKPIAVMPVAQTLATVSQPVSSPSVVVPESPPLDDDNPFNFGWDKETTVAATAAVAASSPPVTPSVSVPDATTLAPPAFSETASDATGDNLFENLPGFATPADTPANETPLRIESREISPMPRSSRPKLAEKLLQRKAVLGGVATISVLLIVGIAWKVFKSESKTAGLTTKKTNGTKSAIASVKDFVKIVDPDKDVSDSERVVIKVGQAGLPKIADALAAAKKETSAKLRVIQVPAGRYEERIVLDASYPAGIHLVADKGEPVILAPAGADPIIDVSGGERVRIQGFELAAKGKDVAVRLSGALKSARIVGLTIREFSKFGIVGNGCSGSESEEGGQLAFDQLIFHPGDSAAVGIAIRKAAPTEKTPAHIMIARCKFFGPMEAGVSFEFPVEDVQVCASIFSQLVTGTKFASGKSVWKDVVHWNNSYFECERAFVFTDMPASGSRGFGFYNNLFVKLKTPGFNPEASKFGPSYDDAAFVSMLSSVGGGIANNWDETPDWTAAPTGMDKRLFDKRSGGERRKPAILASIKPDAKDFLAPTQNSLHRSIAKEFLLEKYPDFIGAVPPK